MKRSLKEGVEEERGKKTGEGFLGVCRAEEGQPAAVGAPPQAVPAEGRGARGVVERPRRAPGPAPTACGPAPPPGFSAGGQGGSAAAASAFAR